MNKNKKGFTLVELLIVIAIIGILAAIVLINLNAARNKAKDAAIKSALQELRGAAEIEYDSAGTYAAVCTTGDISTTGDFGRIRTSINGNGGTTAASCNAGASAFCAQSTLNVSGSWCIDSTGVSGSTADCDANYTCAVD